MRNRVASEQVFMEEHGGYTAIHVFHEAGFEADGHIVTIAIEDFSTCSLFSIAPVELNFLVTVVP